MELCDYQLPVTDKRPEVFSCKVNGVVMKCKKHHSLLPLC